MIEDLSIRFDTSGRLWESDNSEFQYPVMLQLTASTQVPMAFFNSYTSWLNVTADDLRQSKNLEEIVASWRAIQAVANPETCIILAFFPSKAQIYLPFIVAEQRNNIVGGMIQRRINEPGQTIFSDDIHPTWDELMSRRDNMRMVIGEAALANELHFVDVSAAFEAAAANGEVLYYTYDTHWNQAGHDLAGAVIGDFLQSGACD
ncbi:MAG: hypothetical protein Q9P01_12355 [Anaerolineae bacterium]|nr:hypothetical protein [Anaerolineae bacterium]